MGPLSPHGTLPFGSTRPRGEAWGVHVAPSGATDGPTATRPDWGGHGETSASLPGQPATVRQDLKRRRDAEADSATARHRHSCSGRRCEGSDPRGDPVRASGRPWPFMPSSTREYAWLGGTPGVVPPFAGDGGPRAHACVAPLQCQTACCRSPASAAEAQPVTRDAARCQRATGPLCRCVCVS